MVSRWRPTGTYLFISGCSSFFSTTLWVVGAVYYVLSVHMNPFQLVLVGTILEVSYLISQIPTGLFADAYSRRLSFILGGLIAGCCWVVEGSIAVFLAIAAAEAVRGIGEAFVDGALPAWLADEVGEAEFGRVMLRGSQVAQIAGILGMPVGVALASFHLYLPMRVGGTLFILMNVLLAFVVPETNFQSVRHEHVSRRTVMRATLGSGLRIVRRTPVLLTILAIALIFGAFSEGFDRLWEVHFLRDIPFPSLGSSKPVVWFGVINVVTALVEIGVLQLMRRRVDMTDHHAVGRTLLVLNVLLIAGVLAFGLATSFGFAFAAFAVARMTRHIHGPIYTTWLNGKIADSRVRATLLSMQGGLDAFGQSAFGPVIGLLGTIFSLRVAITAAGAILLPALPLYAWALRGGDPVEEDGEPALTR